MPKVSIVIPIYNGKNYIEKSLGSLINQTLTDIEIICVNDCSTDNSLEILQEYAAKDNRIKIINSEKNQGQSKAKNIAIKQASGEFIMFLDQDDWYEPDACELCYNQAKQNNNDIVMFDFNDFFENKNIIKKNNWRIDGIKEHINNPNIKLYELKGDFIRSGYAWCYCYKLDFIKNNNILFPENNRFTDDIPFFIKSIVNADTISVINKALYNYRIYSNSVTYVRTDLWYEFFIAKTECYNYIANSKRAKEFMYPYLIYCIRTTLNWYNKYNEINKSIKHEYYMKMQDMFKMFDDNYDISKIKEYINYNNFKRITEYSWIKYQIYKFIKNIFSVSDSINNTHKDIIILGIKIKLRKRKNK